ncbi:unnamed protein product [Didymodactylos carnosus]|uniref:Uncharacterized protein n=1 Tax=Didymodactylos carnosus TaxID=1234261 RepID=A0A814MJA7_9BILA|nr:unnamed protein product [Didymodactylos carnosus]CAF3846069.1 unnamed protein product [Didymodactylos carnosus]
MHTVQHKVLVGFREFSCPKNHDSLNTIEFLLNYLRAKSIDIRQQFNTKNCEQLTPFQLATKLSNANVVKVLTSSGYFDENDENELLVKLNEVHITEKQL